MSKRITMDRSILENTEKNSYIVHNSTSITKGIFEGSIVSEEFIDRLIKGPECLFSDFQKTQPLTYKALINCINLFILEKSKTKSTGSLFCLCIDFGHHLITTNMINKRTIARRIKSKKPIPKQLNNIPNELSSYYSLFDGLSLYEGNSLWSLRNNRLPLALNDWISLSDYFKEQELGFTSQVKYFDSKFLNYQVWLRPNKNKLVLLDDQGSKQIYVMDIESMTVEPLANSIPSIDSYNAEVIRLGKSSDILQTTSVT
jgi:hypothetical protein